MKIEEVRIHNLDDIYKYYNSLKEKDIDIAIEEEIEGTMKKVRIYNFNFSLDEDMPEKGNGNKYKNKEIIYVLDEKDIVVEKECKIDYENSKILYKNEYYKNGNLKREINEGNSGENSTYSKEIKYSEDGKIIEEITYINGRKYEIRYNNIENDNALKKVENDKGLEEKELEDMSIIELKNKLSEVQGDNKIKEQLIKEIKDAMDINNKLNEELQELKNKDKEK